ncbi:hypothetical protein [Klebsiella aerogenes]|uniref:hypothetical protein n=1 Tax=Klebsiella aerogenes TaxID=548 RepID=UPI00069A6935|nr:hypothetical protein [Klebsiella aerogenes]
MNDITELAQRVKTEVSAIDDTQWYLAKPSEIRLLVEALEKAQQQNISDFEIKARLCKESNSLHDRLRVAEKRIAELEEAERKLCAANVTLDARAELAERQLAELDSRTVTVKLASRRLPSDYVDGEFGNDDLAAIHNACLLECKVSVEKYLSAHGIVVKWEAE